MQTKYFLKIWLLSVNFENASLQTSLPDFERPTYGDLLRYGRMVFRNDFVCIHYHL